MKFRSLLFACALVAACPIFASAQEGSTPPGATYCSTISAAERRVYFGELHLHTTMSFDAWTWGTKVTPDQAYKFAGGQTVMVPAAQVHAEEGMSGQQDVPAKRAWPLDFTAVTDHSEYIGAMSQLDKPDSVFANSALGKKFIALGGGGFQYFGTAERQSPDVLKAASEASHAWDVEIRAANDNYKPGIFTTFIAYEWTSTPGGRHLHRNVIFNADHAPAPFTSVDSERPEDLWSYLDAVRKQGIDVIAIPHNGNLSGGLEYDWNDSNGRPIDEAYAEERALNEPLTEIVQNKGQSDTAPELSPNDEFANFEIFDRIYPGETAPQFHHGSYIREAFGRGLIIQSKVGVNPFKYGLVGDSDIHNGLSTSDESGMAGYAWGIDPSTMLPRGTPAKIMLAMEQPDGSPGKPRVGEQNPLEFSSAGITGVWAEENTRNSIFAALKRKETFATSGTRIRVRMFGGWNFDPKIIESGDWVAKAYADGVPLGGDLPAKPAGASAPRFILQAVKDPDGANLDRIQIIKVWLDGGGYKEKIFDVALSGNRKDDDTGRAPDVGNTVDLKTGTYKNSIGTAVLTTVWQDPEFDPAKPAVYYSRTLEIPTPRWSTLLAIKNNLPIPKSVAATIQERAWTSPIWFTPAKS